MKNSPVKYRKGLSDSQFRILDLVFKFRFVSTEGLAEALSRDRSTIYERLSVLVSQGYLIKKYDSSYKLAGNPATYSLSSSGIRHLLKRFPPHRAALRNMYRNGLVQEQYINHCLTVMSVTYAIKRQYGDAFDYLSKNELSQFEGFPNPKPDLYLMRKDKSNKPSYMLDLFDNEADFMTRRKRLKILMEHEDSGDWYDSGLGDYPSLLFVVASDKIQKRIMNEIDYYYNRYYIDEDKVASMVATLDRLTKVKDNPDKKIWQVYESDPDEDEPIILRAI